MPEARDKKSTRMRLLHFLLSGEGGDHWIFPEKIFAFRKFVGAFVLYHVFIFSIIENRAESCVSLCRLVQFQTALKQKKKKKKRTMSIAIHRRAASGGNHHLYMKAKSATGISATILLF